MSAEAARLLIEAGVASSAAALLVIALRKFLRYALGACAAYWAWLLVPTAAIAVLLPQPEQPAHLAPSSTPVSAVVSGALAAIDRVASPADYATAVLAVWIAGAALSLALIFRRHHALVRSLGEMRRQSDGSLRAAQCREPMLLGVLQPRLVLPPDFDESYGPNERAMVLAHEQAHLRRRDPQVNAIAAAWLCLSWFNPLMYWALGLFRFDQELACDATVLALPGATRRQYADALLKTQLTADLARDRAMMGCHWHSAHPLKERIHMLKRPLPGKLRRRSGLVLMFAFVVAGCYAVKTAQSQAALPGTQETLIAVNMKVFVNGVDAIAARGYGSEGWTVLTSNGGQFWVGDEEHKTGCVARIPVAGTAPAPATTPATGQSLEGLIVLSCELSHSGRTFAKPTLLVRDNEPSAIEATDSEDGQVFRVELNASTTPARVAAASAYWEKSHANGAP